MQQTSQQFMVSSIRWWKEVVVLHHVAAPVTCHLLEVVCIFLIERTCLVYVTKQQHDGKQLAILYSRQ
jgi:hypothetical protein